MSDAEKFSGVYWLENSMDIIFIFDVFLNFRTAYMDKKGRAVTKPSKIANAYCKG